MKWAFLGLGGVFISMIWIFAREFNRAVARGLAEYGIEFAGINTASALIVLVASVLAVLGRVDGFNQH